MIDTILDFIRLELDTYFHARTGTKVVECKLTALVDDAGKFVIPEQTVGILLVNVEEDRVLKAQTSERLESNGVSVVLEPELRLNLVVMVAARFKQYEQALKYLSLVLTFFQGRPTFAPEQYPRLDARITRLTPELLSLAYEQLNQIWAFVGGKHLPSVFYRLRTISLRDDAPVRVERPIQLIGSNTQTA